MTFLGDQMDSVIARAADPEESEGLAGRGDGSCGSLQVEAPLGWVGDILLDIIPGTNPDLPKPSSKQHLMDFPGCWGELAQSWEPPTSPHPHNVAASCLPLITWTS